MSLADLLLFLCSLLQAGNEGTVPRQPVVQPTQIASIPDVPLVTYPPPAANQFILHDGVLVLPKYNRVPLSAPERAVLASFKTEQRDADGNILRDSEGLPIMIPVREGMKVFKGQILGNFDDQELQSILKINQTQLDLAKSEQKKQIEVDVAAWSVHVAMKDVQRKKESNIRLPGTVSQAEVEQAELVQAQAEANLNLQKYNIEEIKSREVLVRESELERTKVQIGLRKLTAPIDGVIVNIEAAEGEYKREGDPILEIVQLDTLWVRAKVNVKEYNSSDFDGKKAVIHVPFANGRTETFPGAVVLCSPLAGVNLFEVCVEVQNRRAGNSWILLPGHTNVDIVIQK